MRINDHIHLREEMDQKIRRAGFAGEPHVAQIILWNGTCVSGKLVKCRVQ